MSSDHDETEAIKPPATPNPMASLLMHGKMEDMFIKWNADKPPRGGVHASSILAAKDKYCHREHVLGFNHKRANPEHGPDLLALFLHGWVLHEKWQALFQSGTESIKAIELEKSRVYRLDNITLSYTPDAIIEVDGEVFIVEIKGYNHFTAEAIKAESPWKRKEYRDAHVQANLYMVLTGIPEALVLIENKSTQRYQVWKIEQDVDMAQPYIDRLHQLDALVGIYKNDGRLVARIPECSSIDSPRAQRCPLREACFASKEARKALEL